MNGWWDEWAAALVAKVGADEWRRGCRGAEGIGEGRGEGGGGGEGGEGGGGGGEGAGCRGCDHPPLLPPKLLPPWVSDPTILGFEILFTTLI